MLYGLSHSLHFFKNFYLIFLIIKIIQITYAPLVQLVRPMVHKTVIIIMSHFYSWNYLKCKIWSIANFFTIFDRKMALPIMLQQLFVKNRLKNRFFYFNKKNWVLIVQLSYDEFKLIIIAIILDQMLLKFWNADLLFSEMSVFLILLSCNISKCIWCICKNFQILK